MKGETASTAVQGVRAKGTVDTVPYASKVPRCVGGHAVSVRYGAVRLPRGGGGRDGAGGLPQRTLPFRPLHALADLEGAERIGRERNGDQARVVDAYAALGKSEMQDFKAQAAVVGPGQILRIRGRDIQEERRFRVRGPTGILHPAHGARVPVQIDVEVSRTSGARVFRVRKAAR